MTCLPWTMPPAQYSIADGTVPAVVQLNVPGRGRIVRLSIVNDLATATPGGGAGIDMEFEIYTLAAAAYEAAGITPVPYMVGPPYKQVPQVLVGNPLNYSVTNRLLATDGMFLTGPDAGYKYANYDGSRTQPENQLWLLIIANKGSAASQIITVSGVIEPVSLY
jgi:hypothetical protein